MDVEFSIDGQVVVDDQGDLLDIQAAPPQVRGDEDPGVALPELVHDLVPLLLLHFAMHAGHGEVILDHLLGQPLHLANAVAEDDGLGDGQVVVQVAQGLEFPLLFLYRDEVLLYALEGQLVALHQDLYRFVHELL